MNITHWVPAAESPRWPCVLSWLNLELPEGATKTFVRSGANHVKFSWNKVVKDFLATDSEWLFSTHNDVVFAPNTLTRLLSWEQPLISALIFMRQSPVVPHIWKDYEPNGRMVQRIVDTREWFLRNRDWVKFGPFVMDERPADAIVPVTFTSTSCTLIHRQVLEDMKAECGEDWFLWDNDYTGGGEDRRFFQIAAKVGYPAWVDRSCVVGHLVGDIPTSAADFMAWDAVSEYNGTGEIDPQTGRSK